MLENFRGKLNCQFCFQFLFSTHYMFSIALRSFAETSLAISSKSGLSTTETIFIGSIAVMSGLIFAQMIFG